MIGKEARKMRSARNAIISIAASLALVLAMSPHAIGQSAGRTADRPEPAPRVMADGIPLRLDPAPFYSEGNLMVPVRPIAEQLGATVDVRADLLGKRTIILVKGGRRVELAIGSKTMIVSGTETRLPAAPLVRSGSAMVPLRAVVEALGESVAWEPATRTAHIGHAPELPVVGTVEKLRELLASAAEQNGRVSRGALAMEMAVDMSATAGAAGSADTGASGSSGSAQAKSADYSRTNVQVEGVDEADWAKTDGRFIYQISGRRVLIADVRNPDEPRLADMLEYEGDAVHFYPSELYVSDGRLVVIGSAYRQTEEPQAADAGAKPDIAPGQAREIRIWPPVREQMFTTARVYALGENGKADLIRELEIEGGYVTSRMIGSALYLVASKHHYDIYPMLESDDGTPDARKFEPAWRDTAVSDQAATISLDRLRYFPESPENGTLLIGAADLDNAEQGMQVSAYLGSAGTVYASTENLYIAVGKYDWPEGFTGRSERPVYPDLRTDVYKFRLDGGSVVYAGQGGVPGHVLNPFSMDEYDGHFRIATTSGHMWAEGDAIAKNNLYVLDERMQTVGKLEDLAPGERIYSARFMGGRAYMVTFRNVDPLFAIDLSDPARPSVLGQLKIPGYSDYLHPYDENHLIGFGKETVTVDLKDGNGRGEPMAFYLGMKISLFDVSDVSQPKEKFKEVIGDRGTHSELLYNHKALLFDRSKGLMAFPVELAEVKDGKVRDEYGLPAYGEFTWQGAYVYEIDPGRGFRLKGRITHLSDEDLGKAGMYGYDYTKQVRRILYAGDTLYTLSNAMLKANALDTLAERGSLCFPAQEGYKGDVYGGDAVIFIR